MKYLNGLKKWMVLMSVPYLTACSTSGGEAFGITAVYRNKYDIYNINVFDESNNNYYHEHNVTLEGQYIWGNGSPLFYGGRNFVDQNRIIPKKVKLTWLTAQVEKGEFDEKSRAVIDQLPNLGKSPFVLKFDEYKRPNPVGSKAFGPYEFEIRSKIPKQILLLTRTDDEYGLGITIEFNETYQKMYWALKARDWDKQKKHDPMKLIVCAGGDLNPEPDGKTVRIKRRHPSDYIDKQNIVPVWPHCELPSM